MTSKRTTTRIAGAAAAAAVAVGGVVALSSGASSYGGGNASGQPMASVGAAAYGHAMASGMAMAPASQPVSVPAAGAARVSTRRVSADPHGRLRFTTHRLSARHGTVRLVLSNPRSAGMPHGIAIRGHGVRAVGRVVDAGGTTSVTARLKRGTYMFFCPVPGHAAAGMTGTLRIA